MTGAKAAEAVALAASLSNDALCIAWMATETGPVTRAVALVRGWLMDELNKRLGDDLFDQWLFATEDSDNANPAPYLAQARQG